MFLGCQFSVYVMADSFVPVILGAIEAMKPWRDRLRVETDDLSTTVIGPPEALFPALEAAMVAAARSGRHVVMNLHLSRGCPGEPDDPSCDTPRLRDGAALPRAERDRAALASLREKPATGVSLAAQIALHPLGRADYMSEIAACIAFAKEAGVFLRSKHFCSKLSGDAGRVFAAIEHAFLGFAHATDHVVLCATISANSPSKAG